MALIYKIACDLNEKVYVGQTRQTLEKRIKQHLRDSKNYKFSLYNAIRKYVWEHFKVEILEDNILLENLDKREIFWGEKYNALVPNGYSLELGGRNNKIVSRETRKKMSVAQKGENHWNYGKHRSEETKRKMSENHARLSGKNNPTSKSVLCYDLEGNFIKEYDCIMDAERELNLYHANISAVCKGKLKKTGNYKFKYKE